MKSLPIHKTLFISLMVLLVLFEFFSMQNIALKSESQYPQIVQLLVFALCIASGIINPRIPKNCFFVLFIIWLFYILLRLLFSTTGFESRVDIFRYSWYCNCFIVAFICGRRYINREKAIKVLYLVMMLVATCYTYINMVMQSIDLEFDIEEGGVSNIIFWSLCLSPMAFLFKNKTWQLTFLLLQTILVVFTMKRSAMISIALILLLFLFSIFSKDSTVSKKNRRRYVMWILFLTIGASVFFTNKFSDLLERNIERIQSIEEDQGSGRTYIWAACIEAIGKSDVAEFVFGHGLHSTPVVIRHTTGHNDFLTLMLELGLFGIILYLIFIVQIIRRIFYTKKRHSRLFYCYASLAIIFLVVGNVGDLFTCYTYLGFMTTLIAILELELQQESKNLCQE